MTERFSGTMVMPRTPIASQISEEVADVAAAIDSSLLPPG